MQSHQINWDIYQRSCLGIQFCLDKWKLFWISAKSNSKHYKFNINLKLFESNATFHHPAFSYFVKVDFDSHVWHVEFFKVVQNTRFLNCHNGWVKMIHQIWSIRECQGKWNFICTGNFFCTCHLLISNILVWVFTSIPCGPLGYRDRSNSRHFLRVHISIRTGSRAWKFLDKMLEYTPFLQKGLHLNIFHQNLSKIFLKVLPG